MWEKGADSQLIQPARWLTAQIWQMRCVCVCCVFKVRDDQENQDYTEEMRWRKLSGASEGDRTMEMRWEQYSTMKDSASSHLSTSSVYTAAPRVQVWACVFIRAWEAIQVYFWVGQCIFCSASDVHSICSHVTIVQTREAPVFWLCLSPVWFQCLNSRYLLIENQSIYPKCKISIRDARYLSDR